MRAGFLMLFSIGVLASQGHAQVTLFLQDNLAAQRILLPSLGVAPKPREIATRVGDAEAVLLGSFVSVFDVTPSPVGAVQATLHLVSGKTPMDDCAVVTATVARRRGGGDLVVASLVTTTSLLSRRRATGPVELALLPDLATDGVFVPGDQLVLDVVVRNTCGGTRTVVLLYDSPSAPSQIVLQPRVGPSTTTTLGAGSTTTTTTSTTTTQPPPTSCVDQPTSGYPSVICSLDTLQGIIDALPAAEFGGARRERTLARRVRAARHRVEDAVVRRRVTRSLRRAARLLDRAADAIDRSGARGRIDPGLGGQIIDLAKRAEAELRILLVLG